MTSLRHFDEMEVRRALRQHCGGGFADQARFARAHALTLQHVHDVVEGRAAPSDKLCKALGFAKVTRYVREGT